MSLNRPFSSHVSAKKAGRLEAINIGIKWICPVSGPNLCIFLVSIFAQTGSSERKKDELIELPVEY